MCRGLWLCIGNILSTQFRLSKPIFSPSPYAGVPPNLYGQLKSLNYMCYLNYWEHGLMWTCDCTYKAKHHARKPGSYEVVNAWTTQKLPKCLIQVSFCPKMWINKGCILHHHQWDTFQISSLFKTEFKSCRELRALKYTFFKKMVWTQGSPF